MFNKCLLKVLRLKLRKWNHVPYVHSSPQNSVQCLANNNSLTLCWMIQSISDHRSFGTYTYCLNGSQTDRCVRSTRKCPYKSIVVFAKLEIRLTLNSFIERRFWSFLFFKDSISSGEIAYFFNCGKSFNCFVFLLGFLKHPENLVNINISSISHTLFF